MFDALRQLHDHIELEHRRKRDARETKYLRTLTFTDDELDRYIRRMLGVHLRFDEWLRRRAL